MATVQDKIKKENQKKIFFEALRSIDGQPYQRCSCTGKLLVLAETGEQFEALVRGGGLEKLTAVGLGKTNWLCAVQGAECD